LQKSNFFFNEGFEITKKKDANIIEAFPQGLRGDKFVLRQTVLRFNCIGKLGRAINSSNRIQKFSDDLSFFLTEQ
jgi:hypothetical protein